MDFAILVTAAPTQQGAATAYQFTKAALKQNHRIKRIFFYGDGIHNGNAFITMPQDETNIVTLWQQLALEHSIDLVICVSAALRRGLIDEIEAQRYDKTAANLAGGFKISGLGQLIEAIAQTTRFIAFH